VVTTILTLYKNGEKIAVSTKIKNHLYKMKNLTILKLGSTNPNTLIQPHSFNVKEPVKSWEVWHKCYGHIGMDNLQELLTKELLDGLTMDTQTPKYDCIPCTKAKQHCEPFLTTKENKVTVPGELTHSDIWGPYSVKSLHGNKYFVTFLEDSTRRLKLCFLKGKDEGRQMVKDYIAYLKAEGKQPRYLCCDQGTEYLNNDLRNWLSGQGIDLHNCSLLT
jgi:hypothetical protein